MAKRKNPESPLWQLLGKAEREILEQALAQHGDGKRAAEYLGISSESFYQRAKRVGLLLPKGGTYDRTGKKRRKGNSPSNSAAPPASEPSAPSGNASPPRAVARGASLSWLMSAARPK